MSFAGPGFIIAIVAISMIAWVITTSIRARHGYPLTDDWGRSVHPVKSAETDKIAAENAQLKETVARLEDRLKVLERIATDPTKRLADEIDQLRD
jgi:cell division protein FtsB